MKCRHLVLEESDDRKYLPLPVRYSMWLGKRSHCTYIHFHLNRDYLVIILLNIRKLSIFLTYFFVQCSVRSYLVLKALVFAPNDVKVSKWWDSGANGYFYYLYICTYYGWITDTSRFEYIISTCCIQLIDLKKIIFFSTLYANHNLEPLRNRQIPIFGDGCCWPLLDLRCHREPGHVVCDADSQIRSERHTGRTGFHKFGGISWCTYGISLLGIPDGHVGSTPDATAYALLYLHSISHFKCISNEFDADCHAVSGRFIVSSSKFFKSKYTYL